MKPFVLLQTRPEDPAADNEYEAFMKFSGLSPERLLRRRIHDGGLPALDLDRLSGIFIGGGPYCVTDPPQKKSGGQKKCEAAISQLLDAAVPRDFPLLAACFIGVLIEHQGGTMTRKFPEVIGGYQMSVNRQGSQDRLLKDLPAEFTVFSGHKESVDRLPKDCVILASTPSGPKQMLRIKRNIYVCQFHPELDSDGLALRVQVYKNYGYFAPEAAASLISKASKHDVSHPVKILRNFVNSYSSGPPES